MKKLLVFLTITIITLTGTKTQAQNFQSGKLLYTIISTDPPRVAVRGHCQGQLAQGSLVIPETVTNEDTTYTVVSILGQAFRDCTQLSGTVDIPNTVTRIGGLAFYNCKKLTKLVIPASVTSMGTFTFGYCNGLTEVDYNAENCENDYYENMPFYGCTGHLIIGEGVNHIPDDIFRQGDFDKITIIGNPTTVIGDYAFQFCDKVTGRLTLGKVAQIGSKAFYGSMHPTSIYIDKEEPPITGDNAFWGINKDVQVNVPCGSTELYQNTAVWNEFTQYREHPGYLLQVVSENENKGEVFVLKMPKCDDLGTIVRADPKTGYVFSHWEINGETFTNENPYHFDIDKDISLVAHFRVMTDVMLFSDAEWYYEILNDNGTVTYQHLECVNDTTIDDNDRVKVVVRTNQIYDKGQEAEVTHEYLYEEDGYVYWWNKELQEFTVLYDLAAEYGDEWEIKVGTESLTMHVDGVYSVNYEGTVYRMLRVSDENGIFSGDIICGIGHQTSFFPEMLMTKSDGYRVDGFRCYWIEDELIMRSDDVDCDAVYGLWHHGVGENPTDGWLVYPNPTDGLIYIETSQDASLKEYRITNLLGQTLMSGTVTDQTIDVSVLPNGMYFLTIDNQTVKLMKQ